MNRLESCPLNKTCQKSYDRFYRRRTDLKNCKNYFDCRVLSAAWKFPIERHYDKYGQYWEVKTTPIISEWYDHCTNYPSNISYCPIRFFTGAHIEIGSWFHRDLPLPKEANLEERDCLTIEEIVAMEIKQTYHQLGFFDAVSMSKKGYA